MMGSSCSTTTKAQTQQNTSQRTFSSAEAHGGQTPEAKHTAMVMIEFQNEFTSEGGKLNGGVKSVMESNNMLEKSVSVCQFAREAGIKVMHAPISFSKDSSDNPNKGLGILKGCHEGSLFEEGTWNSEICDSMKPVEGDLIVQGKKGLDAFPGTNLEELLVANDIHTVVLAGFLTNCCVESTMRTAYEKGFNVITLTDCTATTSEEGQKASVGGTFGMFSKPMAKDEFVASFDEQ